MDTVRLNLNTLRSLEWQNYMHETGKSKLRLRSFLIRLNNQLKYSLFGQVGLQRIEKGKDGHFYTKVTIDSYFGRNYIGEDNIRDSVAALTVIRDSLQAYGTELIIVVAPGKAFIYPEYIPDQLVRETRDTSNYDIYSKELEKADFPFIDFIPVFLQMKDTAVYPIMPKAAVHWSIYAASVAADSVLIHLERLIGKPLPKVAERKIQTSFFPKHTDGDIADVLNLLDMASQERYAYPIVTKVNEEGTFRPNILAISDSYYWSLIHNHVPDNFFSDRSQYYFYFKDIYPTKTRPVKSVDSINNLKEDLCSRDVIILMTSDGTLQKFPYGFISKANQAFGIE